MVKILLSQPYNLKDISNNYEDYEAYLLYLAYIEDNGYMLISHTNSSIFYAVSSEINPRDFYKNPTHDNESYQALLTEIKKHLTKYYDEISEYYQQYSNSRNNTLYPGVLDEEDVIDEEDIFEFLTSDLDDKYDNPKLIYKSRDYHDEAIKNLINYPVNTFKTQLRQQDYQNKNLIKSEDKIQEERDKIDDKILDLVTSIKTLDKKYTLDNYGFFKDILNKDDIKQLFSRLTLGLTDDNQFSQYHQDYRGIYTIDTKKGADGEEMEIPKVIAKLNILDAVRIIDPLEINPTTYILKIDNLKENREVIYEYLTYDELVSKLKESRTFYNDNQIVYVLNYYLNDGCDNVRYEAYKEGFYLVNDKVIENSNIINVNYNKESLREAIQLLNTILTKRSQEGRINDSEVYRFSLWSPFSFILKELGITDSLYGLILIGMSQTNKTGSIFIANHFYNHANEENTGSTPSTLGSRLEDNTFMSVFDECSHLFEIPEAINIMKRAIYEKVSRGVKNKTNNRDIDDFIALGLPVFILNERLKDGFKDFIQNRYHRVKYTLDSYVTDKDKTEFNKEFMPRSPNSILNKLSLIGRAFSDRLIEVIEDNTKHDKLYDMEELTISILKDIEDYAEEPFIAELKEVKTADEDYDYDIIQDIKNKLNQEFKDKNRGISNIGKKTLYNSINKGDFTFIKFNSTKQNYYISPNDFKDYVNGLLTDGMIEVKELIDGLDLKLKIIPYLENNNTDKYSFKNQNFKDNKGKTIQKRGFLMDGVDVLYYIFNITLSNADFEEMEEYDKGDTIRTPGAS